MLTARDEEPDRIVGLEVGADDYITKPFSPRELVARMKAVLRRTRAAGAARHVRRSATCMLDRESHDVTVAGKPVELTAKEFDLLAYFMANAGVLVSRDLLLDRVWGHRVPRRHAHRRRARRAAAAQARPTGPDPHAARRRLQGRRAVSSRCAARLFAATLAALALTLALTIAIGAVLTRRQVDKSQATRWRAAPTTSQLQRRRSVSYINQDTSSRAACASSSQPRARLRAVRPERQPLERRQDDVRGRALPLLVPHAPVARAAAAPAREPALGRVAPVPARPAARRRSPAPRSPRRSRSCVARSIVAADPARRGRDPGARRRRAARRRCPRRARPRSRRSRRRSTRWPQQLAASREAERELPALGQPRAEDAADRDSRLRRGPRRRRVRRRRGGAHDRPRGRPARAARPRPARPRADEPQRVLGPHASPSTSRRSRARPCSGTRPRRATSSVALDGGGRRDVGRGRPRPAAADRVEPRRERAPRDARRRAR